MNKFNITVVISAICLLLSSTALADDFTLKTDFSNIDFTSLERIGYISDNGKTITRDSIEFAETGLPQVLDFKLDENTVFKVFSGDKGEGVSLQKQGSRLQMISKTDDTKFVGFEFKEKYMGTVVLEMDILADDYSKYSIVVADIETMKTGIESDLAIDIRTPFITVDKGTLYAFGNEAITALDAGKWHSLKVAFNNLTLRLTVTITEQDGTVTEKFTDVKVGNKLNEIVLYNVINGINRIGFMLNYTTEKGIVVDNLRAYQTEPTNSTVNGYVWAQAAIDKLRGMGVICDTYNYIQFEPWKQVTRGEYISYVVDYLGVTADVTENFSDVDTGNPYYKKIGIAKALGLVEGYGNFFSPDELIDRQSAFVITARIIKDSLSQPADITGYHDYNDIAEWARTDISLLCGANFVQGDGSNINPLGIINRAEMAVFLTNINTGVSS